jgi:hypothetical protein
MPALEGLTAADEAAVLTADAGLIPEVFLVNSALCGLLVDVIANGLLENSADSLCAAVESAAASVSAGNPSSMVTSASAHPTIVSLLGSQHLFFPDTTFLNPWLSHPRRIQRRLRHL